MTNDHLDWEQVHEARIRATDLTCLALLRDRPDIRVRLVEDVAWLNWTTSQADVVRALVPLPGVTFFQSTHGLRRRFGSRLPTNEAPPIAEERSLAGVLSPSLPAPVQPSGGAFAGVSLRLIRCEFPQPTTALVCELAALRFFADTATTAELAGVSGLRTGDRAILFGLRLPLIPGAARFHGQDVLMPVGFRLEPELPAAVIRSAVSAKPHEVLLISETEFQLIPQDRAEPLTRAGIRLALAGGAP